MFVILTKHAPHVYYRIIFLFNSCLIPVFRPNLYPLFTRSKLPPVFTRPALSLVHQCLGCGKDFVNNLDWNHFQEILERTRLISGHWRWKVIDIYIGLQTSCHSRIFKFWVLFADTQINIMLYFRRSCRKTYSRGRSSHQTWAPTRCYTPWVRVRFTAGRFTAVSGNWDLLFLST